MDGLLLNKVLNLKPGLIDKKVRVKAMLERLRWPVIKEKIELLNCNLDRMKKNLDPYAECKHICTASLKKVGLRMICLMGQKPLMTAL